MLAQCRVPAVRRHCEPGPISSGPPFAAAGHPGDIPSRNQKVFRFGLHQKMEIGEAFGLAGKEIQKIPLRHQGDEFADRGQPPEIADGEMPVADFQIGGA